MTHPYAARPEHAVQIAFNADPNDPAAVPAYVDFTALVRSATALQRGEQYELAQSIGQQPEIEVRDISEYLNSANPSSPYYPNVTPYRSILWQALWPNGGKGNLLNPGSWVGNTADPIDPSFQIYANGYLPTWVFPIGATPNIAVSATGGVSGHCLFIPVVTVGQGTTFEVPCIPGRAYVASAYVTLAGVSGTTTMSVDSQASGITPSSTTATGSYQRLTVKFTATQPIHALSITLTAGSGAFLIDQVQHEEGTSPTVFSASGTTVIYPVFAGFIERFRKVYQDGNYTGYCSMPCVDAMAALQSITVDTPWTQVLTQYPPDYSWPLRGTALSQTFLPGPSAQPDVPSFHVVTSPQGAGTLPLTPGAPMNMPGDAGGTGATFYPNFASTSEIGQILALGMTRKGTNFAWPPTVGTAYAGSFACWVVLQPPDTSTVAAMSMSLVVLSNNTFNPPINIQLQTDQFAGHTAQFTVDANPAVGGAAISGFTPLIDGKPHLVVGTITYDSVTTATSWALYVDGVQENHQTGTSAPPSPFLLKNQMTTLDVGGWFYSTGPGFYSNIANGSIAGVNIWNRVLSPLEVLDMWNAGGVGYAGQTSGEYVGQHLFYGSYNGNSRISVGQAVMGAPSYDQSIALLTDIQNTANAEQGHTWVAPDGALVFESRDDRFLRLTPRWTVSCLANTTLPYLGDIEYDVDPNYVFANVQVSLGVGGTVATGGSPADVAATIKKYFDRANPAFSVDLLSADAVQDLADWIFYTHWYGVQRVAAISFDPASNPTLWPFCLSVEIGQRMQIIFRSPSANAGAGATFTADFFVESVAQTDIDVDLGTWTTTLMVSPVGLGTPASTQPWILQDATYGVLDSTTRLGL